MDDIILKTVIIDDEQDAVKAIELIVSEYCPNIKIVGKASSAAEGIKEITGKKPDLVFLDIEMPHMNGFQLLESISDKKFEVIFITAYNHYAIKAFKVCAIDYILKPINIVELVNSVNKVVQLYEKQIVRDDKYELLLKNLKFIQKKRIALPTGDGTEFIDAENIIKIEAEGSYSKVYFVDRKAILVSKNLKEIETIIDDISFFRPHKSYIINLSHVKKYNLQIGGEIELIDGTKVIISRRKRDDFIKIVTAFIK
ncbi:MAG: response regulator transcription factor [Bacteroidales bacterium]|nr:response regulator transcription factor [Bacteroidales bacterium]